MPSPVQVLPLREGKVSFENKVHGEIEVVAYENFVNQCTRPASFLKGRKKCDYVLKHTDTLYRNPERLKNLIGDLYGGEERVKKLFRRALVEEKLSVKVYEIAQKPANERKPFYNRLASQFAEGNYFPLELSLKVVGSLVTGLTGEVLEGAGLGQEVGDEKGGKGSGGQGQPDAAKPVSRPESKNRLIQVGNVQFEMVHVEGGTFRMGATEEQGEDAEGWEKPVHRVILSSYLIGKHEVTQALWEAVMGSTPSYSKQGGDYPVEHVSWDDCQEFVKKLNVRTGMKFRMPTEAEWEYAARGGNRSKGYKYAGSDNLDEVGWYDGNSGCHTHPVGEKKPNELGLYDMSGNLYEWCQDWGGVYINEAQTNPTGRQSGVLRVLRGGSRWGSARSCRVSNRYYGDPGSRYDNNRGLRLVLSL
ncbi:MAG: formylglycine-generating enzyme family protein [Bacteroidetes bacterium]|uniref:Formylglycine-generating enzyme family protein n=1 Tax=Candidatus Pullibacteroides excrementavium TaxID=2840905 RepID=A0A9D9H0Y1_9BACT|nr:formylglycine-generating enzyme family protein [Candidatus Pullibacteroides excrementavium]